jgi:mannose-6-phosphate isomerase-like protein (cupin superfamily)
MPALHTKSLAAAPDAYAPDGSEVRLLAALAGGSFAHFTLPAGGVSAPVSHRTVEEIWYVVAGEGEVWRKLGAEESVTPARPGVALTIPLGTHFQFRAGAEGLSFVAVTMPPWPGPEEAYAVAGKWAGGEGEPAPTAASS